MTADLSWFAGSYRRPDDDRLFALTLATSLAARTGVGSVLGSRPLGRYAGSAAADDGSWAVGWDGGGDAAGTVLMEVRQSALEALGRAESVRLASDAVGDGFRASRVDLVAVATGRGLRPGDLFAAWRRGSVRTRVRRGTLMADVDGPEGLFVGARSSDRYGRFYEARGGGAFRLEVELKRSVASVTGDLLALGHDPTDLWADEVRSLIDWPYLPAWRGLFAS